MTTKDQDLTRSDQPQLRAGDAGPRDDDRAILRHVESVARRELAIFEGSDLLSFGDGCHSAYGNILGHIGAMRKGYQPKPPADVAASEPRPWVDVRDAIMRDACESEAADPNDEEAICLSYEQLSIIVTGHLEEFGSAPISSQEGVTCAHDCEHFICTRRRGHSGLCMAGESAALFDGYHADQPPSEASGSAQSAAPSTSSQTASTDPSPTITVAQAIEQWAHVSDPQNWLIDKTYDAWCIALRKAGSELIQAVRAEARQNKVDQ